ncbi:MAG: NAD(P)H-hydrate dehydratase, partial [Nitrospinota bacterium]
EEDVRGALPERAPFAHKGDCGHILVVAGSAGKTGAACMTASSALRVGAGLVTLGIPASLNTLASAGALEAMTLPLPETEEATLDLSALGPITEASERVQVLVLGPGLTTHPSTVALVHRLVQESPLPMVIDADGLNALAQKMEILSGRGAPTLLTPHPGEMARLMGLSTREVQRERVGVTQGLARERSVYVALKGARTVIAEPGGRAWINPTGNSGMASAGMGDVLTGAVAGLLAQGMEPLEALLSGVYLHGLAGDLASETLGRRGYLASDVIAALPQALSHLGAR